MKYSTSVKVAIDAPRSVVFKALANLDIMHLWNVGMLPVPQKGQMRKGVVFDSTSIILGEELKALVEVCDYVQDELLEFRNETGAIIYWAQHHLIEDGPNRTIVESILRFEAKSIVVGFAHGVIEEMAHSRTEANLMALKAMIEKT